MTPELKKTLVEILFWVSIAVTMIVADWRFKL